MNKFAKTALVSAMLVASSQAMGAAGSNDEWDESWSPPMGDMYGGSTYVNSLRYPDRRGMAVFSLVARECIITLVAVEWNDDRGYDPDVSDKIETRWKVQGEGARYSEDAGSYRVEDAIYTLLATVEGDALVEMIEGDSLIYQVGYGSETDKVSLMGFSQAAAGAVSLCMEELEAQTEDAAPEALEYDNPDYEWNS